MSKDSVSFKSLNLDREKLDSYIESFYKENKLNEINREPSVWSLNDSKLSLKFGKPGMDEPALVYLFLNKDGTTTVDYKRGRNPDLGKKLAVFLRSTINPDEFERVDLTLHSISEKDYQVVLECLKEEEGFRIQECSLQGGFKTDITSVRNKDKISLLFYPGTSNLRIQGRPLSCYKALVYHLTELLDLSGLEKVLTRKEAGRAEIVRESLAADYLATKFGATYQKLTEFERNYLTSVWMIKLSSPELPDYSFLLLPELRVLEGAIKFVFRRLFKINMGKNETFGAYFAKDNSTHSYYFKYSGTQKVSKKCRDALESAYNFYYRERHGFSHSGNEPALNPVISDFSVLQEKSGSCLMLIKDLYDLL